MDTTPIKEKLEKAIDKINAENDRIKKQIQNKPGGTRQKDNDRKRP